MKLLFFKPTHLVAIILLTLAAYFNIFSNHFVGDDFDFIHNWIAHKTTADIPGLLAGDLPSAHVGVYRPLRSLLYYFAYVLFGKQVFFYHFFSFFTHLAITGLIYQLVKTVTSEPKLSLITALLFATHPIHTEAITFITASFDTFSFIPFFISFILFVSSTTTPPSSKLLFLSQVFFVLSFLINETTLILPLLLAAYLFFFPPRLGFKSILQTIKPFLFLAIFYLTFRLTLLPSTFRSPNLGTDPFPLLLLSLKVLVKYLQLLLFPIRLSLVHTFPPAISNYTLPQYNLPAIAAQNPLSLAVILPALVLLGIILAIIKLQTAQPLVSFSLTWIILALLPVINLIPTALIFTERYAYLASFGYCLLVAWVLSRLSIKTPQLATLLFLLLLTGYTSRTFTRNYAWSSHLTLWQTTARQAPENGVVFWQLGQAYQLASQAPKALVAYQRAITLLPDFLPPRLNLASLYLSQSNYTLALAQLTQAYQLEPTNPDLINSLVQTHYLYAQHLLEKKDYSQALSQLNQALKLRLDYQPAFTLRSQLCATRPRLNCSATTSPLPD